MGTVKVKSGVAERGGAITARCPPVSSVSFSVCLYVCLSVIFSSFVVELFNSTTMDPNQFTYVSLASASFQGRTQGRKKEVLHSPFLFFSSFPAN